MDLLQILQGAAVGTLDAKKEVAKIINGMPVTQRRGMLNMLPKVEAFAKKAGLEPGSFYEDARKIIIERKF